MLHLTKKICGIPLPAVLFLLFSLLCFSCFSKSHNKCYLINNSIFDNTQLLPIKLNDKWGYIDTSGTIVIKPQFDYAKAFSEGLAAVLINNKYGFVNKFGDIVIKPQYEIVGINGFKNGLITIGIGENCSDCEGMRANCKNGIIDKTGKEIISPTFEYIEILSRDEGVFRVGKDCHFTDLFYCEKWGLFDDTGNIIIEPLFYEIGSYSEGLAKACYGSFLNSIKKCGFINKKGQVVIEPAYTNTGDFSEGLAPVRKCNNCSSYNIDLQTDPKDFRDKYQSLVFASGYIDANGRLIMDFDFDYTTEFSEGLAGFRKNGKMGYIDKNGIIVIPPQYYTAGRFHNGFAVVIKDRNLKYGLINKSGDFIISPKYDFMEQITEGFYEVSSGGKHGIIDRSGKIIVEPIYDILSKCRDELCRVIIKNKDANPPFYSKAGVININGEYVIKPQFEEVRVLDNGIIQVRSWTKSEYEDGKMGYMDRYGNYIWEPTK